MITGFLNGFAWNTALVATISWLPLIHQPEEASTAQGLVGMAGYCGLLGGSLVGTPLIFYFGWQAISGVVTALYLFALAVLSFTAIGSGLREVEDIEMAEPMLAQVARMKTGATSV
jgi:MFS family permease